MAEVAAEEADAAELLEIGKDKPDDLPDWAGIYWQAWQTLRDDRHYGDYGAIGQIWFSSIKAYADQYGISGSDFEIFLHLMREMDDEHIAVMVERQKEAEAKRKAAED